MIKYTESERRQILCDATIYNIANSTVLKDTDIQYIIDELTALLHVRQNIPF